MEKTHFNITKEVVNKKNIFPKGVFEKEPYIACAENNRKLTTLETHPPSNLDIYVNNAAKDTVPLPPRIAPLLPGISESCLREQP